MDTVGTILVLATIFLLVMIAIRLVFGRQGTRRVASGVYGIVDKILLEIEAIQRDIAHGGFDHKVEKRLKAIVDLLERIADEDVNLGLVIEKIASEQARIEKELITQRGYQEIFRKARADENVEFSDVDEVYTDEVDVRVAVLTQQIAVFESLSSTVKKFQVMVRKAAVKGEVRQYSAGIEAASLQALQHASERIHDVLDKHADLGVLENPLADFSRIAQDSANSARVRLEKTMGIAQVEEKPRDLAGERAKELEAQMQ